MCFNRGQPAGCSLFLCRIISGSGMLSSEYMADRPLRAVYSDLLFNRKFAEARGIRAAARIVISEVLRGLSHEGLPQAGAAGTVPET